MHQVRKRVAQVFARRDAAADNKREREVRSLASRRGAVKQNHVARSRIRVSFVVGSQRADNRTAFPYQALRNDPPRWSAVAARTLVSSFSWISSDEKTSRYDATRILGDAIRLRPRERKSAEGSGFFMKPSASGRNFSVSYFFLFLFFFFFTAFRFRKKEERELYRDYAMRRDEQNPQNEKFVPNSAVRLAQQQREHLGSAEDLPELQESISAALRDRVTLAEN